MEGKTRLVCFLICLLHNGITIKVNAESSPEEIEEEQPRIYKWRQYDYTGTEEIDMTSLESIFHPVLLTSELHGDRVKIMMSYTERIASTPFWQMKFDGVSYTITEGNIVRNGKQISTTIDLPALWNNYQFLAFSVSSDIGTYYIELDYDVISTRRFDMSVPRMGMKMEVPDTFAYDEFPVKLARDSVFNESCFRFVVGKALLREVNKEKDTVERLLRMGVYTKNKTDTQQTKIFGIMVDYLDHDVEVIVYSYCNIDDHMDAARMYWTYGAFKHIQFVDYTRRKSENKVEMKFVDGIYGNEDIVNIDDSFAYRSIACEVFGYPKPIVSIIDKDGQSIRTVELKQNSDMTSHVVSSLEEKPIEEAVGNYTCTATSGDQTINKTIQVIRVIRPEILMTEVVVNNTEEIIAFCIARGQPAPKVSFSVDFVRHDKLEKRPLLETQSTVQHIYSSQFFRKGGLNIDKWFEHKVERCPKPNFISHQSFSESHDVTKTLMTMKALPYLSRYQVKKLYCTAEGYDRVYTTAEVTTKVFGALKMFFKAAKTVSLMYVFG